ncbi:cold-shock protein (plasmid) [Klebsiella aerogenes]|nr:cold-shock protein [Klebsiella aerogenes]
MAMNGTITTWFKDKGFGFIKDENGENRYFHVIKVANPDLIKKDAAVTFEPTTNNKGLSAYAVKVIPESKYIYIAGERVEADLHQILCGVPGRRAGRDPRR